MTKEELAFKMYQWGTSQTDIAELLNTAPNTVTKWKQEGGWDEQIEQQSSINQKISNGVRKIVHYQVHVLEGRVDSYLQDQKVGSPLPLLEKGEFDAILKGVRALEAKKSKLEDVIRAATELLVFVRSKDINLAKQVGALSALFIESLRGKYE